VTLFMHRRRRPLVWLCIAAAMLLGLAAQLHGLSHALQALKASTHDEPLALQTMACDQCLQFAAFEGAVPAHSAALVPRAAGDAPARIVPVTRLRAAVFTAYISRAPPTLG
jgi:hypothetical protein